MKLDIVTPYGRIFEGDIKEVYFPGIEGEFGVLNGHSPLVTTLVSGLIAIKKDDGNEEIVAVDSGYVKVLPTHINVLVDSAEPVIGKGVSDIAKAIKKAKKLIKEASDSDILLASVEAKIESASRNI